MTQLKSSPMPCVNSQDPQWAKSSRSGAGNDCVEVTLKFGKIRDTKDHAAGVIALGSGAAAAFARRIKSGQLDLPMTA